MTRDMNDQTTTASGPKRLWLVAVVAVVVVAGAWSSIRLRAEEAAAPVRLGNGRPQLIEFGMGVCEQCKRMRPVMECARRKLGARVDVRRRALLTLRA